jgi:hypothetical protein
MHASRPTLTVLCSLALAACDARMASTPHSPEAKLSGSWFTDVTSELGVHFQHGPAPAAGFRLPEIMGGGVAVFDCDGDDDLDLYFTSGARNRLFVQDSGSFRDATDASGLADAGGYGMGVAVGDVEGDGDLDVYVANLGADRLYLNRGDGTFADHTRAAGIDVEGWSSSAAFADLDGDGALDLYVVRYVAWDPDQTCLSPVFGDDWCGPKVFDPLSDVLLLGRGDGTFEDASVASGIAAAPSAGLGVLCAHFVDEQLDIYVANDAYPNQLWRRAADGTFFDAAPAEGLAVDRVGTAQAGMGLVFEDLDGDPAHELLVTNLRTETNTLYDRGSSSYDDTTARSGLARPSLDFTGFGVVAFDAELDGDLDLAVANGHVNRGAPSPYSRLPGPWNELPEPNHFFLNDGTGTFAPAPEQGAGLCRLARISRGLAAADLDRDGDLDLVVANLLEPARVLRNDAPRKGAWLSVQLQPERLGARVRVTAGGVARERTALRTSSYLSSGPAELHFGLGPATACEHIDVHWPDGTVERFPGGAVDRRVILARGQGEQRP